MLEFSCDAASHTLTCALAGRMDSETSGQVQAGIEERLAAVPDANARLVLNMAQVSYMASAFLRVCITMAKRLPRERFAVVECVPLVRKTFTMAGLDQVMSIS